MLVSIAIDARLLTHSTQRTPKIATSVVVAHNPEVIRYLPLGDSYTIGQSVAEADHLHGILFVDRIKNTKSYMTYSEYMKQVKKQKSAKHENITRKAISGN